ncbi:MAG: radical SAM protein [Candidatus Eremiobacteraeota bacterium]|nr:radical SAM protein [Candidatus Eremiobacteraeota bacterium]
MKAEEILLAIKEEKKSMKPGQPGEAVDILLLHLDCPQNLGRFRFSLGLLYIATVLMRAGFRVKLVGAEPLLFENRTAIENGIKSLSPKIVGFYTIADNIYPVRLLARKIKKWLPETKIVLGGPQATVLGKQLLKNEPAYDYAIAGEGEISTIQLARALIKKDISLEDVPGLVYRELDTIVMNELPPFIENLDLIPFPDHGLVAEAKDGFQISTARGCPYHCTFCFQKVHGHKVRARSPENVVSEIIQNLEKYSAKYFSIVDDTFIYDVKRAMKICKLLSDYRRKSGRKFLFFCQGRANLMSEHPELLPAMKDAGLDLLQLGIESGDPVTLKHYKKQITPEQVEDVVRQVKEIGEMTIEGNFIIGGPFESRRTVEKSIDFARRLLEMAPGIFECSSSYLGPYPGTEIWEHPERFGIKILDRDFRGVIALEDAHVETTRLKRHHIRNLMAKFKQTVASTMWDLAPEIPKKVWEHHRNLATGWGLMSGWYKDIFLKCPALVSYFLFYEKPRFGDSTGLPWDEFMDWIPFRTVDILQYNRRGNRLIIPGYFKETILKDPKEIFIYELCGGKLTIGEISREFCNRFCPDEEIPYVAELVVMPLLKRLEETYHIIYYL